MKKPNYRIYDMTGGGITHDIHADTLEEAIDEGRDWIEDGEWEPSTKATPLECCVRQIVRYPSAPDRSKGETLDTDGDILAADGTILATVHNYGEIDDCATADGDSWDCSGVHPTVEAPDCEKGHDHDWCSPQWLGGLSENPGVWGSRHGGVRIKEVCAHCGRYRITDTGATDSAAGQQCESVEYREPDEASLAWCLTGLREAIAAVQSDAAKISHGLLQEIEDMDLHELTRDEADQYLSEIRERLVEARAES